MNKFQKCWSVKTNQHYIACIEKKTVYFSTMDGVVYKQIPREHFSPVNPKDVVFPGNYQEAIDLFKEAERGKNGQKESKKSEKKRLEAEKIYKERKKKVLFLRSARNLAMNSDTVTIYRRGLYDMSWYWDDEGFGSWEDREDGYNWEYFLDESQMRDTEELKTFVADTPILVGFHSYILFSEDILDITNYDDLIRLVDDSHDIGLEEWMELRPDYKSLKGCILAEWSRKHGSSREEVHSLCLAGSKDTEELLYQKTEYNGTRLVLSPDDIEKKTQQELKEYLSWYLKDCLIDCDIETFLTLYADQEIIDMCGLGNTISCDISLD